MLNWRTSVLGQPSTCPKTGLQNEPKRLGKWAKIGTTNWTPYLFVFVFYIRSFGLTQKYQKVKWLSVLSGLTQKEPKKSRLRLLSYSVTAFRCARRKLAALRQRRSGRSTSFLRLTLTRTIQLTIENWRLTIFFFSFIYQWNRFRDCRGFFNWQFIIDDWQLFFHPHLSLELALRL